jgi:hypothetical protein
MGLLRSAGAIVLGVAATTVLVYAGNVFYVQIHPELMRMKPGDPLGPELFNGYAVFNVLTGLAFALAGGFITATAAGRQEILHGAVLAAIGFAVAAVNFPTYIQMKIPMWYPLALAVVMPLGSVAGAFLRARTKH